MKLVSKDYNQKNLGEVYESEGNIVHQSINSCNAFYSFACSEFNYKVKVA